MNKLSIAPLILVLAQAVPAAAQTAGDAGGQPQTDKCRVQPEQGGTKSGNQASQGGSQSGNLTAKLDDCNGVLKPPVVGDQEMTTPAPAQGNTPIIKPGEVPAQPPAK
jgi:hypothetical protein